MKRLLIGLSVGVLSAAALGGLAWGCVHALKDSADLEKRSAEYDLFRRRLDPYASRDMSYPPTAPPLLAMAVGPFAGRGDRFLRTAWMVLNLVLLAAVCCLIVRIWGREWPVWLRLVVCLAVAASKPARLGIGLGQFHLAILALMLASLAVLRAGRPIAAGLLLGASLIKPTMSLPLSFLYLIRRRWIMLTTAMIFQAAMLTATSLWLGIDPRRLTTEWLERAKTQETAGAIDWPTLVRSAFPDKPVSSSAIALGLLALGTLYLFVSRKARDAELFGFCSFLAAIFAYHRAYDMVLLFPPFAEWVDRARCATSRRPWAAIGAIAFAGLLIAPSNPAMVGPIFERFHDLGFIAAAHGFFWIEVVGGLGSRQGRATTACGGT